MQTLFRDPELKDVAKSRDFSKIAMHPKFVQLAKDPGLEAPTQDQSTGFSGLMRD